MYFLVFYDVRFVLRLEYWVLHHIMLICSVWLHLALKIAHHINNSQNIRIFLLVIVSSWFLFDQFLIVWCDIRIPRNISKYLLILRSDWYPIFIIPGILSIISCKNCLCSPINGLFFIPNFFPHFLHWYYCSLNSVVFPLIFCLFLVIVPFLIILWDPQLGQIGLSYLKVLFSSKNNFELVFSKFGTLFNLSEMIFSWSIFSSEKS